MPKLEADYKRQMVKEIKDAGGYGRRIEDQFGVGIFDIIMAMPGTELVSVEVKRFTGNQFNLSPRQAIEMHRMADAGVRVAAVGVLMPIGRIYIHGLTKSNRDTTCLTRNSVVQAEGESFPELFKRYIGEKYGRPVSEIAGEERPVQRSDDSDDAARQPARRSGGQLPDDSRPVVDVHRIVDETPSGW